MPPADRGRGAAPSGVGLRPLSARDGTHLRRRRRWALRDLHGGGTDECTRHGLRAFRRRVASRGGRGALDGRITRGVRAVPEVAGWSARSLGRAALGSALALLRDQYATDRVADEAGLLVALNLEREARHDLEPTAAEIVDIGHLGGRADVAAGGHRRRKPDLVPAVVHAEHEAGRLDQSLAEAVDQAEREIAVRHCRAERALGLRALDVDVDPLVVAGELGERVDYVLGDSAPVARANGLTLKLTKPLDSVRARNSHGRRGYSMSLIPRKLPAIAPAPVIRPSTRMT